MSCSKYYHVFVIGGGNFGRDKIVRRYVSSCNLCQHTNPKLLKQPAMLHPIPVKPEVWHRVGIDLIGPLRTSIKVNRYIATCTNYFSKWIEAEAIPDKTAQTVAKFLLGLICRFGCFSIFHSDQGRKFVNQPIKTGSNWLVWSTEISSAYHPQSNGLDEWSNQTISRAIVKYVNDQRDDWDEQLQCILFSYRTSVHPSTVYAKFSPFFLIYRPDPVLPIELKAWTCRTLTHWQTFMSGSRAVASSFEVVRPEGVV